MRRRSHCELHTPLHRCWCSRLDPSFRSSVSDNITAIISLRITSCTLSQSINQSIEQTINQSINHSFNQSINKRLDQSTQRFCHSIRFTVSNCDVFSAKLTSATAFGPPNRSISSSRVLFGSRCAMSLNRSKSSIFRAKASSRISLRDLAAKKAWGKEKETRTSESTVRKNNRDTQRKSTYVVQQAPIPPSRRQRHFPRWLPVLVSPSSSPSYFSYALVAGAVLLVTSSKGLKQNHFDMQLGIRITRHSINIEAKDHRHVKVSRQKNAAEWPFEGRLYILQ